MNYCELVVNVRLQHFYFIRNLFLNHSIKKKKKKTFKAFTHPSPNPSLYLYIHLETHDVCAQL